MRTPRCATIGCAPPPGLGLEAQGITSGPLWDRVTATLLSVNGEDHARLRRLVSKAFTPRSVARLDTTIVDIITELTDPLMAAGRCEVVADIARPYPVPVICELLGAPKQDWQLFSVWADEFFKTFTWKAAEYEPDILKAWGELDDYVDGMVAERRNSPTDDLISDLIRAEDDGDRLSMAELRMLAGGLLMAGTDTTRNQVAAAVDVLCDHPDQWDLLADHPELAMKAVEELMRFYPVVFGAMRMTIEDVEYEGVVIPAGTFVMVNTASANRDADRLRRPGPPRHHPRGCGADADVRRRRALLPRREPRPTRNRRSPEGHGRYGCATCDGEAPRRGSRWSESPALPRCPWNSTQLDSTLSTRTVAIGIPA